MLRPRSIAIAGASPTPGSLGGSVLANLERFGFTGEIHLINPNRRETNGRPCLKSPADLPDGVDCAVLAIPRSGVLDAMKGCAARRVGGVVIFSAGFAETGPEGRAQQDELARIARDAGMAGGGTKCPGFVQSAPRGPPPLGGRDHTPPP